MGAPTKLETLRRRTFLIGAGTSVALLAGCDTGSPLEPTQASAPLHHAEGDGVYAFRLSTRGRRASRALKSHAANMRFASEKAAEAALPYPNAPARVVRIAVSRRQHAHWFSESDTVDLRHPPLPPAPGELKVG